MSPSSQREVFIPWRFTRNSLSSVGGPTRPGPLPWTLLRLPDFVVWSQDLLTRTARKLLKAEEVMTALSGERVFERE